MQAPVALSVGAADGPAGSTTTGTRPPLPAPAVRLPYRRRQVNSRLAFTSLRRATSDTETPGW